MLNVGSVVELRAQGLNNHPLHVHVFPFQLQLTTETTGSNYFQVDAHPHLAHPPAPSRPRTCPRQVLRSATHAHRLHAYMPTLSHSRAPSESQAGDWHDTFLFPFTAKMNTDFPVRIQLDRFTTNLVVHCHLLTHEDEVTLRS